MIVQRPRDGKSRSAPLNPSAQNTSDVNPERKLSARPNLIESDV